MIWRTVWMCFWWKLIEKVICYQLTWTSLMILSCSNFVGKSSVCLTILHWITSPSEFLGSEILYSFPPFLFLHQSCWTIFLMIISCSLHWTSPSAFNIERKILEFLVVPIYLYVDYTLAWECISCKAYFAYHLHKIFFICSSVTSWPAPTLFSLLWISLSVH